MTSPSPSALHSPHKRQLYGLVQQIEEGLFLRLLAADELAGAAAEGAKLHDLAASPAEPMDAFVAKNFAAAEALVSRAGMRMARAEEGPVGEHHGRRGLGPVEFGYRNDDFNILHQQRHITKMEFLASLQPGLGDSFVTHKRSIGGLTVAKQEPIVAQNNFAVMGGDSRVLNLKVILRAAPNASDPQLELNHLVTKTL
jgi:hypothetical protein